MYYLLTSVGIICIILLIMGNAEEATGIWKVWRNAVDKGEWGPLIILVFLVLGGGFLIVHSGNSTTVTATGDCSISTNGQSGGSNTTNCGNLPRTLSTTTEEYLLSQLKVIGAKTVSFHYTDDDTEANKYAHQIADFLRKNGYQVSLGEHNTYSFGKGHFDIHGTRDGAILEIGPQ